MRQKPGDRRRAAGPAAAENGGRAGAGLARPLVTAMLLFVGIVMNLAAEAPIAAAAPRKARARVVSAARSYIGTPYLYGGMDRAGIDCSGLVSAAYADALGTPLPRDTRGLYAFVELIPREKLEPGDLLFFDTTDSLSHVGIYSGDGSFIHAASDGPRTGVIESSLSENYWSRHFVAAGRVLPPAGYYGIVLTAALMSEFGTSPVFRGLGLSLGAGFRIGQGELGLALRPAWDAGLGTGRIPLVLSFSLDRKLAFFAGPVWTLGSPALEWEGGLRNYAAAGGILATAGIVWTPVRFYAFGQDWGLCAQLEYDRYVAAPGEAESFWADLDARLSAGIGLSARWSF